MDEVGLCEESSLFWGVVACCGLCYVLFEAAEILGAHSFVDFPGIRVVGSGGQI